MDNSGNDGELRAFVDNELSDSLWAPPEASVWGMISCFVGARLAAPVSDWRQSDELRGISRDSAQVLDLEPQV